MTRYTLARLAEEDLSEIWDHSVESWGHPRTERYFRDMFELSDGIASSPETGTPRPQFGTSLRSKRSGRHLVFNTQTAVSVVILRIVHESRNLSALTFFDRLQGL